MAEKIKEIPLLVKKFIERNNVAHVATLSADQKSPQIATVYYVFDNDSVYFATRPESVKIKNINANNRVAIVITDATQLTTLQLAGAAEIVREVSTKSEIVKKYNKIANGYGPNEFLPLLKTHGFSIEIVKCNLRWFRYSDFSGEKQTMIEAVLEKTDD